MPFVFSACATAHPAIAPLTAPQQLMTGFDQGAAEGDERGIFDMSFTLRACNQWQSQAKTDTSWVNATKTPANTGASFSAAAAASTGRKVKMWFNNTRELEQLPGKIEARKKEQANLTEVLADGSLFVKSPDTAANMSMRLEVVASEINAAMNRWELLQNKRSGLSGLRSVASVQR